MRGADQPREDPDADEQFRQVVEWVESVANENRKPKARLAKLERDPVMPAELVA